MNDKYFDEGRQASMAYWGLGQMMKGAGYAAIFVLAIAVILGAIYAVSLVLPAESKQAPSPYSAIMTPGLVSGHALV